MISIAKIISPNYWRWYKKNFPNEYGTINTQRKSLNGSFKIDKGQVITEDMIVIKEPGCGLPPKYSDIVIGRMAKEEIKEDYPII